MISQSENKLIYIANNDGLLEYNGAKWSLYPSPNNAIIRSVKVVGNIVYTGSFMEFGFWKKNMYGILKYKSLTSTFENEMLENEQIWNIIEVDNWIIFQSSNRIYMFDYKSGLTKLIESKYKINRLFRVDNEIYFDNSNASLFKLQEGKEFLFIKNEFLKTHTILNIFNNKEGLLFLTKKNGFYQYKNNVFTEWKPQLNRFLKMKVVYSSILLKDKSFILGTISNGIFHISPKGEVMFHLNHSNGLSNNTILSLFLDVDKNVWLGLDNGINIVNMDKNSK
ncbi:MAG: hypothetical protein V3U80_03780 [Flavobacteriaceae bacterium]